jgi:mannose-6-phosphate isomerase-like protein (cupin superfamily)
MDVPAAWLLLDSTRPPRVVRASERPSLSTPDANGAVTEVDGGTSRDVRVLEVTTPPGVRTGEHAHAGDEHHLVLSGKYRMTQGEHTYELGAGDYLAWDASVPHDVENIGDEPGRLLLIYARHARGQDRA